MITATHQVLPYRTAPAIGYSLIKDSDTRAPTNLVIYHGVQPDGRYLNKADLDSHGKGQDARAAWAAFKQQLPAIAAKMDVRPSKNGGIHAYFYTNGCMPHGKLYDQDRRHIGEMIASDTAVSIPPEDLAPGWLSATERDLLLRFWTIDAPVAGGKRWTDRAAEGLKYIAGAYKYHYSEADLVRYLRTHCNQLDRKSGAVVRRIGADYLDGNALTTNVRNRSDTAGNLMQTILLFIRRAYPAAGFVECIQRSYMLWRAAESFGKASDKDYNAERDGASLIGQIIHGDPYGPNDTRQWKRPHWAEAHPTPPAAVAAPEPSVRPTRPAHRPAGDRDKMRRKIRRYIELRAFETDGKLYYSASDLADAFGIAKRTMQTYLAEIPEITRGQDGGSGGRAWLVWCADNSEDSPASKTKAVTEPCKNEDPRGADTSAVQSIQTPQSDNCTLVSIVDHQDLSVPITARPAAAPAGAHSPGDLPSVPEKAIATNEADQRWYEAWIETDEALALLEKCVGRHAADPEIYARMLPIQRGDTLSTSRLQVQRQAYMKAIEPVRYEPTTPASTEMKVCQPWIHKRYLAQQLQNAVE